MKKLLLCFTFLLILVFGIFAINYIRNFIIIKKIFNLGSSFVFSNNYKIEEKIRTPVSETKIFFYYKDGSYLYESNIFLNNEEESNIVWYNEQDENFISLTKDENGNLIENSTLNNSDNFLKFFNLESYIFGRQFNSYFQIINKNIFYRITMEDDCYKVKSPTNSSEYFYINRETGLIQKLINSDTYLEFTYKMDCVKERDLIKPII